jgi:hypothetical protein
MPNGSHNNTSQALDYAHRLFENYIDWYKTAETKAQVLLTLVGGFLTFLTGSAFAKRDDLKKVVDYFGIETWILLAAMCLASTLAIVSAIVCLWSRTNSRREVNQLLHRPGAGSGGKDYPPQVMWFFQFVHELDPEAFTEKLLTINDEFAIRALGAQVVALSRTVTQKHKWVNVGFASASASLIIFVAAMISYVVRAR